MRAVQSRVLYALSALFLATLCHAQTVSESKINLAPYGFVKSSCVWYPGDVEFLDDEHLVLSAPAMTKCDKSLWDSPTDTTITVINLKGEKVASSHRSDVIRMSAGPLGYVSVCVGDHVELLSVNLQVSASIPLTEGRTVSRCSFYGELTPSRNGMVISGPGHHEFTLYRVSPAGSTRIEIPTGYNVRAVADDGLLLCKNVQCEVSGSAGVTRRFPSLEGAYEVDIKGLISQDKLLVADRDGKRLHTVSSSGEKRTVADLSKIKPPFINSSDSQLSAAEPRRLLYRVDGCLLGDFDDCYGDIFHRFAVFDTQNAQLLFRHDYAPTANLKISPNGRTISEQNGTELRLFRLP